MKILFSTAWINPSAYALIFSDRQFKGSSTSHEVEKEFHPYSSILHPILEAKAPGQKSGDSGCTLTQSIMGCIPS